MYVGEFLILFLFLLFYVFLFLFEETWRFNNVNEENDEQGYKIWGKKHSTSSVLKSMPQFYQDTQNVWAVVKLAVPST